MEELLGFTLIFGILRLVNFAHGEFYMLGAFAVYHLTTQLGLNYFLALALAAKNSRAATPVIRLKYNFTASILLWAGTTIAGVPRLQARYLHYFLGLVFPGCGLFSKESECSDESGPPCRLVKEPEPDGSGLISGPDPDRSDLISEPGPGCSG